MKTGRSAALPLLFVGLLLALGAAAALLLPLFACPPCEGHGLILEGNPQTTALIYACVLCDQRGRIRLATRLRANPDRSTHRGALRGKVGG